MLRSAWLLIPFVASWLRVRPPLLLDEKEIPLLSCFRHGTEGELTLPEMLQKA
jgi:hypothetical protein